MKIWVLINLFYSCHNLIFRISCSVVMPVVWPYHRHIHLCTVSMCMGERGGSVVECWTPEREVGGSKPTAAVFTPRKYWLITQEAVAPSQHD